MDFLHKFGSSMRDMMKPVQDKVQDGIQLSKLNFAIRKTEDELEKQYAALGRECYAAIRANRDAVDTFRAYADTIDKLLTEKKNLEEQKNIARGERRCPSCGTYQARDAKFCPTCGAAMPTEEPKEEPTEGMNADIPEQREAEEQDDCWAELKEIHAEIQKSFQEDASGESENQE